MGIKAEDISPVDFPTQWTSNLADRTQGIGIPFMAVVRLAGTTAQTVSKPDKTFRVIYWWAVNRKNSATTAEFTLNRIRGSTTTAIGTWNTAGGSVADNDGTLADTIVDGAQDILPTDTLQVVSDDANDSADVHIWGVFI